MSATSNNNLLNLLKNVEQQDPENTLLAELYKRHKKSDIESLITDLRKDASNTIGSTFTGPVDYDECVKRVAKKVGIKDKELADDEIQNELLILQRCLKSYFEKLSPAEREEKIKEINKEFGPQSEELIKIILQGSGAAFLALIQAGGTATVALCSGGVVISTAVLHTILLRIFLIFMGTQTAFNAARFAALAIPFLNVVMGAWLVFDLSGPAYRKIVPSVLNIALLRLSFSKNT